MMSQSKEPGYRPTFFTPVRLVSLLILAGLVLRFYRLDYQSLWYDESFAVLLGMAPLAEMMQQLIADFVHPPLHYLLLYCLDLVNGLNSYSARALSAVLGCATIPVLYLAGRHLYSPGVGLVAALLFTVSQLGVMYSQEARPYALQMFTIALLVYCFSLALKRHYLGWWVALLAAMLAIYTQYYSAFVILPLCGWAVCRYRVIGLHRIIIGALAAIALYLPWLLSGIIDAALTAEKTTGEQPGYFAIDWESAFDVFNRYNNGSMDNVLSGGPKWLFFTGAFLFTAPAVMAAASTIPASRLLRMMAWGGGAAMTLGLSLAYGNSTAGLALFALYLVRCVLIAVESSHLSSFAIFQLAIAPPSWALLLLAAFAVCVVQDVYAWIYFMLGIMAGCIILGRPLIQGEQKVPATEEDPLQGPFLWLACLAGVGVPLLLGTVGMQFDTRYTLSALPLYYLLVAAGITQVRPIAIRSLLIGIICLYSLLALRANYFSPYKENWRDSLALVIREWHRGDCVTVPPDDKSLPYPWFAYRYERQLPDVHFVPAQEIVARAEQCQRIWFLQYGRVKSSIDAGLPIRQGVEATHRALQSWNYHWVEVTLYGRVPTD